MNTLSKELDNLNNPALGAIILWRFVAGYETGSGIKAGTPFPLLFIVIPMILQPEILDLIKSTYRPSGLRMFSSKFSEPSVSKNDIVYSIQPRAREMENLSRESLKLAIATNLVSIDPGTSLLFPVSVAPTSSNISKEIDEMLKQAYKLGFWCSQVTLHEISIILKVEF
jgi:hypothetical protein